MFALVLLAIAALLLVSLAVLGKAKRLGREAVHRSLGVLSLVGMADTALVLPANTFYASAGGLSPKTAVKKAKTVTGIRFGTYVQLDTDDEHVKLAVADSLVAIGIVIGNLTDKTWDGTTDPTAEDALDILLIGSGEVGVAWTDEDLSLSLGASVGIDASGYAKAIDTTKPLSKAGRVVVGADGSGTTAKVGVLL